MIIIRFGLDWEALIGPDKPPHQQVATCRRIVKFWEEHGVLVLLGGAEGRRQVLGVLGDMPQSSRKLWKEALLQLRRRCVELPFSLVNELLEAGDLAHLSGHVDLIGADDDRCGLLGVGDEDVSVTLDAHGIEVVRIHSLEQAGCVTAARQAATADIRCGATPDRLWEDRVGDLVPWSKEFVVVDRYCGVEVARCSGAANSGLEFVLRQVWDKGVGVKVFMATARVGRDDDYVNTLDLFKTSVLNVVLRLLDENGTRTHDLALYRLRDSVFAEHSHDRYLRFDSWLLKLDVGLEPFSAGAWQRSRSAFEMSVCNADGLSDKKQIEKRLRAHSDGIIELPAGATSVVGVSGR